MRTPADIGEIVSARRIELALSRAVAAQMCQVDRSTWVRMEKGDVGAGPRLSTLAGMAAVLKWRPDWYDFLSNGGDIEQLVPYDRHPKDRIIEALDELGFDLSARDAVMAVINSLERRPR